jgi:hypothetical protein
MKKLYTLCLLLFAVPAFAQQTNYHYMMVEATNLGMLPVAILPAPNNGIMVLGTSQYQDPVMRFDSAGQVIWSNYLQTTSSAKATLKSFCKPDDSTYVIAATADDDVYLIKINDSGTVLLSQQFNLSGNAILNLKVLHTKDHGFLLTGVKTTSQNQYGFMFKTDSTFGLSWSRSFYKPGENMVLSSAVETDSNEFIITGAAYYYTSSSIHDSYSLLVSIDGNLNTTFLAKRLNGSQINTIPNGIIRNANGDIYTLNNHDGFIVVERSDSLGATQWARSFQLGLLNPNQFPDNLLLTSDNRLIFQMGDDFGFSDVLIVIDSMANVVTSGSPWWRVKDICQTADSSVIFLGGGPLYGVSIPGGSPPFGEETAIMKSDNSLSDIPCFQYGNYSINTASLQSFTPVVTDSALTVVFAIGSASANSINVQIYDQCIDIIGSIDKRLSDSFTIYPNPAHTNLSINITTGFLKNVTIELFDLTGKMIRELYNGEMAVDKVVKMDISDIHSGIYMLCVVHEGTTYFKKLTVQ